MTTTPHPLPTPRRPPVVTGPFAAWAGTPAWAAHLLLVAGLGVSWAMVRAAGGSSSAMPHVFYLVVLAAAARFHRRGGLGYGAAAAIVCGPLVPLDTVVGLSQPVWTWLWRGVFFVAAGALAGGALQALQRSYLAGLTSRLEDELTVPWSSRGGVPVGGGAAGPGSGGRTGGGAGTDTGAVGVHPGGPPGGGELRTARERIEAVLEAGSFRLVFQPIYSLADGHLVAVEVLTRFQAEPARSPDRWFAEAARVGLGTDLDLAVLEQAMVASEALPPDVALSINCSPTTLADPRFVRAVEGRVCRPLILELTEHVTVDDYQPLDAALRSIRASGARLAIDDAGAGFSSLRHIVRLGPEIIKLDISLTQGLRDDPVRRALADALIGFARQTGSLLVAEGIEHGSDLATWVDLGAHAAQGYHLGRPGSLPVPTTCPQLAPYLPVDPTDPPPRPPRLPGR